MDVLRSDHYNWLGRVLEQCPIPAFRVESEECRNKVSKYDKYIEDIPLSISHATLHHPSHTTILQKYRTSVQKICIAIHNR